MSTYIYSKPTGFVCFRTSLCQMTYAAASITVILFQKKYKIKDTGFCSEKGFKAPMLVWFKFLLWQTHTTVMKYSFQKFMNILVNLSSPIATGQSM